MSLVNKSVKIEKCKYNGIDNETWYNVLYEYTDNATTFLIIKTPEGVLRHVSAKYVVEILPEPENTIAKRLKSIENLLKTQSVIGRKVLFPKEVFEKGKWTTVNSDGIILDKFLIDGVNKYLISDNEKTYYVYCNSIKLL